VRLRRLEKLAAPEVYERRLRSLPGAQRIVEIVFIVALTPFIVLLSIGVLRRWRWTFWLAGRVIFGKRPASSSRRFALFGWQPLPEAS